MRLHFLVHFDEGFGETDLHQHKSKLGPTFLDLYCKTGVFLVEIYNRLDEALKKIPAYTDDQVRRTHILNEQLFGLSGSDGMPLLMSQRNLYGQIGVGNIRYIGADNMGYTDIIK